MKIETMKQRVKELGAQMKALLPECRAFSKAVGKKIKVAKAKVKQAERALENAEAEVDRLVNSQDCTGPWKAYDNLEGRQRDLNWKIYKQTVADLPKGFHVVNRPFSGGHHAVYKIRRNSKPFIVEIEKRGKFWFFEKETDVHWDTVNVRRKNWDALVKAVEAYCVEKCNPVKTD